MLAWVALGAGGCLALAAAAGGGGTVLWQGGKVIAQEEASVSRAVAAAKEAFKAQRIALTDEVTKDEVTQLRGKDPGHAKVAVDIFEKGPKSVRIEIRVGLGDQIASRALMDEIKKRL
ncbi:MAG: DUF3568 family protein [Candidatus Omnitrophica bacterium]|nr:DUF3568 family protein [Candidatus Omnitrophota bacterium]